ncbi:NUDIX hydrolase [Winogradskyella aurantiaca]|uniref:NUDIX hydrolase n=1 Tax=Winogradskyella aurantiaca TaxID=2219558 RepID=UPI002937160B|nr:CoA pyrophosphatase [Winogradskyella aurantiaca]
MSPPFREHLAKKMMEKSKTAKRAAVLAMFYPNTQGLTNLVLILRNTYPGVHSAQVGFPGGRIEPTDPSIKFAALRETEEEIGIPTKSINVVKTMSPLYIPPSNFLVYPFMGILNETPSFIKDPNEVQEIIEVSLNDFLSPSTIISTNVPTSYDVEVEVPAFLLNNFIVWGATAMMLSEIKEVLNEIL